MKPEFSKLLIGICVALAVVISAVATVFCFKFEAEEPLVCLVTAVFSQLAAASAFYFNKAKRENEIKLRKSFGRAVYNDTQSHLEENYD